MTSQESGHTWTIWHFMLARLGTRYPAHLIQGIFRTSQGRQKQLSLSVANGLGRATGKVLLGIILQAYWPRRRQ